MGACGNAVCVGKKSSTQTRPNTIKPVVTKPAELDLDSSMDNYDEKLTAQIDLLAPKVDVKVA